MYTGGIRDVHGMDGVCIDALLYVYMWCVLYSVTLSIMCLYTICFLIVLGIF
jgi:hypothetical protein